jgi:hypothetical protein
MQLSVLIIKNMFIIIIYQHITYSNLFNDYFIIKSKIYDKKLSSLLKFIIFNKNN